MKNKKLIQQSIVLILLVLVVGYFYHDNKITLVNNEDSPELAQSPETNNKIFEQPITQHQPKITLEECTSGLKTSDSSIFLELKRQLYIEQLVFENLQKQKTNTEITQIAIAHGIKPAEINKLINISQNPYELSTLMRLGEIKLLVKLLEQKEHHLIVDNFEKGRINHQSDIFGAGIITVLMDRAMDIQADFIEDVINAGVKVSKKDLLYATKNSDDLAIITLLHQQLLTNPKFSSIQTNGFNEFIIQAIEALNPIALTYWLENTEQVKLTDADIELLDFLPSPKTKNEVELAKRIVELVSSYGHNKINATNYQLLAQWLPQTDIINLNIQTLNTTSTVSNLNKQLTTTLLALQKQISEIKLLENDCKTLYAMDNSTNSDHLDLMVMRMKQEKSKPKNNHNWREILDKLTHLQTMSEGVDKPAIDGFNRIVLHTNKKQWQKAIDEAALLMEQDNTSGDMSYYNFILAQAVLHNAPLSIINNLIDQNAKLEGDEGLLLAMQDNLKLMKELVPLGLDLHYINTSGKSVISQSIQSNSQKVFDYLLANNVNIESPKGTYDSLNYALDNLLNSKSEYNDHFITQLLGHGKKINSSHKQQLELIAIKQPNYYNKIAHLFD